MYEVKIHNPNKLKTIDYRTLKEFQGNLKDLNEKNAEKLRRVLEKRGFKVPLYLWDSKDGLVLLDGHQRLRVMQTNQMNDDGNFDIPYILIEAKDENEAREQLLEISSQYGTITQEGYDEFTANLPDPDLPDVNFDALAFVGQEEEPEVEEDEAPEVSSEPPVSQLGVVYQLGRHRVGCMDSTVKENVELLMNGQKADMVFTDPPYGNGQSGKYGRGQLGVRTINGDEDFSVTEKALTLLSEYPQLFFLQWRTFAEAYSYVASVGKTIKTIAVWDKKNAGLNGAGGMAEQWEAIIVTGDSKYKKFGGNVFRVSREQKARVDSPHPHQKPIELLAELFNFFEASTYIDLFLGSGSTLIACEQTDRTCYGMELDPKYVDVIRKRYAKFIEPETWEESWEELTPVV